MKIKLFFTLTILLLTMTQFINAQTYSQLWQEVEALKKADRPQSIIQQSERIYEKALREDNAPEKVKAFLYIDQYKNRISPDSAYETLQRMEQLVGEATDPVEKAIWHSLLAEWYGNYLGRNQWQLVKMGKLTGEVPADIRQWSSNLLFDKITYHIRQSLIDFVVLLRTNADTWTPAIEKGESSIYYSNDIYHLLFQRSINILESVRYTAENLSPQTQLRAKDAFADHAVFQNLTITPIGEYDAEAMIIALFQQSLALYEESRNPGAQVLTDLGRLTHFQRYYPIIYAEATNESLNLYIDALNKLIRDFGATEVTAEVYLEKATYFINRGKREEALFIVREAIQRYPKYQRINALKNIESDILAPFLNIAFPALYPEKENPIRIYYKNLTGFTLEYYRPAPTQDGKQVYGMISEAEAKITGKPLKTEFFSLSPTTNYQDKDTLLYTQPPSAGNWLVVLTPEDKRASKQYHVFPVTSLSIGSRRLPDNRIEVVVIDSWSGKPIAEAMVMLAVTLQGDYKTIATLVTEANGKAFYTGKENIEYIRAEKGEDTYMEYRRAYLNPNLSPDNRIRESITLLTDRSVYRPGQTVYVKGVAYRQQERTTEVISGKSYTVTLRNANNQEVSKQTLTTNDFGSLDTQFILPASTLNGTYRLETPFGNTIFRVESYKRPTFTLTLNSPIESYQLGDTIQVTGEARTYSGVPIQGIPVQYTITRIPQMGWRSVSEPSVTIASGESMPENDGKFSIPVELTSGTTPASDFVLYSYYITTTLTNESGETQANTVSVLAGNRSLLLDTDITNNILKDNPIQVTFKATNLAGKPIEIKGTYSLYPKGNNTPLFTGNFTSNVLTPLDPWQSLPSGEYRLKITANDVAGREVSIERELILYSLNDKTPPVDSPVWMQVVHSTYNKTTPATILFGTSQEDVVLYYDVFTANRILESRMLRMSGNVERFDYPAKEEYGQEIYVTFFFMKKGETYLRTVQLQREESSKELNLRWEVFRDKLRPGSQEEWKLTITHADGTPAQAEMLAMMYDASLDKIYQRSQGFFLSPIRTPFNAGWLFPYTYRMPLLSTITTKSLPVPALSYNQLLNFNVNIRIRGGSSLSRSGVNTLTMGMMDDSVASKAEVLATTEQSGEMVEVRSYADGVVFEEQPIDAVTPRSDFSETAFFYPYLRTSEHGDIVIAFTLPESLTQWNFRGYAHTRDMITGTISASATASKEFMVTPNIPRFIRVGDEITISAGITNLTTQQVNGTATLELFDPETEKVIRTQNQPFNTEAGETGSVTFAITADESYDLIGCRIVASGKGFSDGEQHLIPVLSNREMITESILIPLREGENKNISLSTLFNNQSKTATDKRLTVEFTANPIWYAIQALPTLNKPTSDNAISWASAFYTHTLAAWIVNKNPAIRNMIEIWKSNPADRETLLSNLMRNEELKNILIEESPWLLEAQNETEQKERLALLFDLNTISSNTTVALEKLADLQLPGGGWSWYKGMNDNFSVTCYVLNTLIRIPELTGIPLSGNAQTLLNKALTYLHNRALAEYRELTGKEELSPTLSLQALTYLYLVTLSGETIPEESMVAYNYFMSLLPEGITTLSLSDKATAAIILYKTGREKEAEDYLTSIKEYLIKSDEMGTYFDQPTYNSTGSNQVLATHVRVMEALSLLPGNQEYIDNMQVWILKQKQTRAWNTPVNTVNAVYALLKGNPVLNTESSNIRIQIGNVILNTREGETGTGYIKRTFDTPRIVNSKQISLRKESPGVAWGAIYAQYREEASRITGQESGIQIEKQLYIEEMNEGRKEIRPVTTGTILSVGDKVVVRVALTTDRSLDFVQLKDARGGCFEPLSTASGYQYGAGTGYYVEVKDAATNFFFDSLQKGVYILEYSYYVNRKGNYNAGIATFQSAYAPEFVSHSYSMRVTVE